MRIGIDARLLYYSQAGISQYTKQLTRAMARLNTDDEFIIFHSRKDDKQLVEAPNFKRVSLWTPCHHRLETFILPMEVLPHAPRILHSPDFIPPKFGLWRSVITVHDLSFLLYPNLQTRDSARYYGQIDQAVKQVDHIIAVSQSTKNDLVHLLGCPANKISVIYEAASPVYRPMVVDAGQAVAQKWQVEGDYILFVSTIEPRKNIPTLLRAFRNLLDEYRINVKLLFAGSKGWLYEEIFRLVEELKLTSNVRFLGRVDNSDLVELYNAARLFVYPSTYEGFGLPPLEAMACGTPVITSNVSSLPEVVGDAALLVDPLNIEQLTATIWRALSDENLRSELTWKGLRRAHCFSWERAARETMAVYEKVAG